MTIQSAGINLLQSPQSDSTPWTLTLDESIVIHLQFLNKIINFRSLWSGVVSLQKKVVHISPSSLVSSFVSFFACFNAVGQERFLAIVLVKFIYSEKATKFCEISTLLLSFIVPIKSKVEISQNFVAFSEYMNFTTIKLKDFRLGMYVTIYSTWILLKSIFSALFITTFLTVISVVCYYRYRF